MDCASLPTDNAAMNEGPDITALLASWRAGNRDAEAALMKAVYPALREIARARLARTPGTFTLRATELVHEAYSRLAIGGVDWQSRAHFFGIVARAIRNVVVDYQRERGAEKRGADLPFVALEVAAEEAVDADVDLRVDWIAVNDALDELEASDAQSARIVELKFFSGLTTDEIAEACSISRATVVRDWRFARVWLSKRLNANPAH